MRATSLAPGELVIERARLTGNGGRGVLEAALAHVIVGDVAGDNEILLIPRLHAREPLSKLRSPGDFGARLTEQLRALRQAAAIDPAGPVANAPALRFTSKARYAGWLIASWLGARSNGTATAGVTLPEPAAIRDWLRSEVLGDGPVLVATAARLWRQGLLAAWIARLDPTELALAAASLERAYAVPSSAAPGGPPAAASIEGISWPARAPASSRAQTGIDRLPATRPIEASEGMSRLLRMIWAGVTAVDPGAKALTPAHARAAHALAVLAAHPNLGRLLAPAALDRARTGTAEGPARTAAPAVQARHAGPQDRRQAHRPSRGGYASRGYGGAGPPDPSSRPASEPPSGGDRERSPALAISVRGAPPAPAPELSTQVSPSPLARGPTAIVPPPLAHAPAAFRTAFGGVFFLVNVLLALGLYPDFTRPRDRGLAPSPLWLLDRLALRLFGRAYRGDPLHRWLSAVGLPGRLPAAWEADPQWLAGLPPAPHRLCASRVRTILWDARGFALVDAPAAPPRRRGAWLRRYAACGPCAALPPQPRRPMPRDADARWIACLAELVTARLALAGEGLGPRTLCLPASVVLDEERIEVAFDLARLPIEIRLAGLDRDPGWLPAEGRSLTFTFQ